MFIDLSALFKGNIENLKVDEVFKAEDFIRDDFKIQLTSPVHVEGILENMGRSIGFKGIFKTTLKLTCSRCLKEYDQEIEAEFDELFSKDLVEDAYLVIDNSIDLKDLIMDNIILSLPLKPLCSKECKGLCPHCGRDLNREKCSCKDDSIDPRLSVLKNFFSDQGGANNG